MFYGLDVHKEFVQVCRLSKDGRRRCDFRIPATEEALEAFAGRLGADDRLALEATFHSWAIHAILAPHAGKVVGAAAADLAPPSAGCASSSCGPPSTSYSTPWRCWSRSKPASRPSTSSCVRTLFTDIVGYTALMAESDAKGHRVREWQVAILRPIVERYGGDWVQHGRLPSPCCCSP